MGEKMAEIPQECNIFTWSIQNFVRKVKQFVRKYITSLIDLVNKLYDIEKFLISFYVMCYIKFSYFIKKFCRQTY